MQNMKMDQWRAAHGFKFNPASLYTGGAGGITWDLSNFSTMFQDSAGTTSVVKRGNLLTKTEQFDNVAWVKTAATVSANTATAPDGSATADKLFPTAVASTHLCSQGSLAVGGGITVLSVYAKAAEYTRIGLRESATTGAWAVFDVSAGTALGSGGGTSATSITSVGNGWYRCSMTASTATAGLAVHVVSAAWVSGNPLSEVYSGNGTDGLLIWGAQLEAGSTATRYQRVNTATDYDSAGFPYYLQFNGTNVFMQSAATIDFTATDKMTSCLGFTVASAVGIVLESSAIVNSNNGSFFVAASQDNVANQLTSAARAATAVDIVKTTALTYTAGSLLVFTQQVDLSLALSTSKITVSINGAQPAMSVSAPSADTAGNFGNYTMYMGARAGTSIFHNGRIYSGIIVGRQRTAAERVQIETWVNARTGAF